MFLARNEVISNLCHWHDLCRLIVDRRLGTCSRNQKDRYCVHAIIASGRVRLSSDGGAKIARYALLPLS